MGNRSTHLTLLLRNWSNGDRAAGDKAFERMLPSLRRVARQAMSKHMPGSSLHVTDLVNEAYLRLSKESGYPWKNRDQFFAVASLQMRRALKDEARKLSAGKRGKGWQRVTFDQNWVDPQSAGSNFEELMYALEDLVDKYPRRGTVVELRFFGGLSMEQISRELGVSLGTVKRDWQIARAWLYRSIRGLKEPALSSTDPSRSG